MDDGLVDDGLVDDGLVDDGLVDDRFVDDGLVDYILMRLMIKFLLVQEGFLGSQINLNLPNVIKSPCRTTKYVYGSHFKDVFCVQNMKIERVLLIQILVDYYSKMIVCN